MLGPQSAACQKRQPAHGGPPRLIASADGAAHALSWLGPALQEQVGVLPGKGGLPGTSQRGSVFPGAQQQQQQQQQAAAALPAMPSTTVTSGEDTH